MVLKEWTFKGELLIMSNLVGIFIFIFVYLCGMQKITILNDNFSLLYFQRHLRQWDLRPTWRPKKNTNTILQRGLMFNKKTLTCVKWEDYKISLFTAFYCGVQVFPPRDYFISSCLWALVHELLLIYHLHLPPPLPICY